MPRGYCKSPTAHAALTVFTPGKEGHSPKPSKKEAWRVDPQSSASYKRGIKASQSRTLSVKSRQDLIVYIEPVQIHIEGIFSARALFWAGQNARQSV